MWYENWKRTALTSGVAMILATATTGCGVFNGDDDDDDRDLDRIGNVDTYDRVPQSARVVAEGQSRDLSFKADKDGRVYLYDFTNDKLVNSWDVEAGQRLTVSPDNKAISLADKPISRSTELSSKINYRLLFDERD